MIKVIKKIKHEIDFFKNLRNININFLFTLAILMIFMSQGALAIGLTITDEDTGSFSLTPTNERLDYLDQSDDNLLITLNKFDSDTNSYDLPVKNTFFVRDSKIFKYGALDEENQGLDKYQYSYRSTYPLTQIQIDDKTIFTFNKEQDGLLSTHTLDFSDICTDIGQCEFEVIDDYNFNLRFISADLIDPIINVSTSSYADVAILALTNQTFATGSIENGNVLLRLYNTTGTLINQATLDTGVGSVGRVKLAYLNSTTFIASWFNNALVTKSIQYQLYNMTGSSTSTVQTGLGFPLMLTDNIDFSVTANSNTIFLCSANDLTNNNEINIISSSALGSGTNVVIDASDAPESPNSELVSCWVMNSSRIRYSYFDDPSNDILAVTLNNSGATIISDSLDTNAGETAHVDNVALGLNLSSTLWYDSGDSNIYLTMMTINGTQILAPVSIDNDAGTDSRVSLAVSSWQNKSVLIASWNDRTTNAIQSKVYLENGTNIFFYNITNVANSTQLMFDTYGKNSFFGSGICNDTYLAIFHNTTGKVVAETLYVNGTISDGICNIPTPAIVSFPQITNLAPPNNTISNITIINFNATITDAVLLKNASLFIYNLTGSLIYSNSTQLSINSSFLNFTQRLTSGTYFWQFLVYNTQNNTNLSESRLLVINGFPQITNLAPPNNTFSINLNITFNGTISDTVALKNASLLIYNSTGSLVSFNSTVTSSNTTFINFTQRLTSGTYFWQILAYNFQDNINLSESRLLIIDNNLPQITNLAPPNNTVTSNTNILFNATVTDTNTLKNASLFIYNASGSLIYTNTTQLSSTSAFINFSQKLTQGVYFWNFLVYNIQNSSSSSESRLLTINGFPQITNILPLNNTSSTSFNVSFNASISDAIGLKNATLFVYNASLSLIFTNTTSISSTSGFVNFTQRFLVDGLYYWNFLIYNNANNSNQSETRLLTIEHQPNITIVITYPLNITYLTRVLALNYSLTHGFGSINACWYSLDKGVTNNTITCGVNVTGIMSSLGQNTWRVYANDTNTAQIFNGEVNFIDSCSDVSGSLAVPDYPYVDVNVTYPFKIGTFGNNLSRLQMIIINPDDTNQTFNLTYNPTTQRYEDNFLFTAIGDYKFRIFNSFNNTCPLLSPDFTGVFFVREPFYITLEGYINKTLGTPSYINDFAVVTAEFKTFTLSEDNERYLRPIGFKDSFKTPVFHAKYTNGKAVLKLWENATYNIRLFDGIITFDSVYSPPNIAKTYGVNVFVGEAQLIPLNQTYQVYFSSKDIHPYRYLFNAIMIVLLVVVLGISAYLFIMYPHTPISLIFGILFSVILIGIRLAVWFYTGT